MSHGKRSKGDFDKNGVVARNRAVSQIEKQKPISSWLEYLEEIAESDPEELGQPIR